MKKHISNIILVLIILVGLSLLLYPGFSDYWNSLHQSRAITTYNEQVSAMSEEDYSGLWEQVEAYNDSLTENENRFYLSDEQTAEYESLLNVSDSGVMGYIEVPTIQCSLPIYHGTSEGVLQQAIGHLEWTSLPEEGESVHTVFSGHRGLPSARLFTDLDKVVQGDVFFLHVLDKTIAYQVDQIRIVEPHETKDLLVTEGENYCTLVTCTPYGINSHRLLVRGKRIAYTEETPGAYVVADAVMIDPLVVAPILALPMLLLICILWWLQSKFTKNRKRQGDDVSEILKME